MILSLTDRRAGARLKCGPTNGCAPSPSLRSSTMLRLESSRAVSFCDGLTRRDFLHAGAIAGLGLTLPGYLAARAPSAAKDSDINCIMLFLVGGPSQIDTWDPKPSAP